MKVSVVVKPGSRKESIEFQADGSLLIRVNAHAVEGQANERVVEILSEHYQIRKSAIRLLSGTRGRKKLFEVG